MTSDAALLTPAEAFTAVLAGKMQRYARPGMWRVFRMRGRVVFEALAPANDPSSMPDLVA